METVDARGLPRGRGRFDAGGCRLRVRGQESCTRTRGASPPGAVGTRPRRMSPAVSEVQAVGRIGSSLCGPRRHRLGTASCLHRAEKPLSAGAQGGPILGGRARCPLGNSRVLVPANQRRTTMRRPTRTALRTLRTSVMLARSGDPLALPATLRRLASGQDGMATAEYAIGTLATMYERRHTRVFCCYASRNHPSRSDIRPSVHRCRARYPATGSCLRR